MIGSTSNRFGRGDIVDGRFRVERVLGSGNFATVYEVVQYVYNTRLRRAALKLFKEDSVSPEKASYIFNDAITLNGLMEEQPDLEVEQHLVRILDGGLLQNGSGTPYLVMDLVDGDTLHRGLRRFGNAHGIGGLPVALSLYYLQQIIKPLAWMHRLDPAAVHGDLHAGNVLLTAKGHIKVADFGLAGRLPAPILGGALSCQSPETLLNRFGDTRSDVYAIGLLWYELLTGKSPFDEVPEVRELDLKLRALADDDVNRKPMQEAQYAAHIEARKRGFPPASEVNRDLRANLAFEDILNKCLAYRPSERFYTADDLQNALANVEEHRPVPAPHRTVAAAAKSADPKSAHLDQARRLAARGAYDEAQAITDKILQEHKECADAWRMKAEVALLAAKDNYLTLDAAFEHIGQALALAPENPDTLDLLADAYALDGRWELQKSTKLSANKFRTAAAHKTRSR